MTKPAVPMRSAFSSLLFASLLVAGLSTQPANAQDAAQDVSAPDSYKEVGDLVELPDFVPGLGVLYVQPDTLPAGPFLGYDREGSLVNTTYMLPLDELNEQSSFESLGTSDREVDHVDVQYNPGHPGVDEPHYHVILWHISSEEQEAFQS